MKTRVMMERDFTVPVWSKKAVEKALNRYVDFGPGTLANVKEISYKIDYLILFNKFTVSVIGDARAVKETLNTIATEIAQC